MLSMIRFGADAVFNSKGGVTDEDIDVLIARGEERSKADNDRFKEHANSLANFSLGGARSGPGEGHCEGAGRHGATTMWHHLPCGTTHHVASPTM